MQILELSKATLTQPSFRLLSRLNSPPHHLRKHIDFQLGLPLRFFLVANLPHLQDLLDRLTLQVLLGILAGFANRRQFCHRHLAKWCTDKLLPLLTFSVGHSLAAQASAAFTIKLELSSRMLLDGARRCQLTQDSLVFDYPDFVCRLSFCDGDCASEGTWDCV